MNNIAKYTNEPITSKAKYLLLDTPINIDQFF